MTLQHHITHQNEQWRFDANKALVEIIQQHISFKNVIDIGCGYGYFLGALKNYNPDARILGIDANWVDLRYLQFSPDSFLSRDLEIESCKLNFKADLVVCLEVAEHLSPARAQSFCKELTSYNCPILFSAAIPGQGGQGHLNEQFLSYWLELFWDYDFRPSDVLHASLWINRHLPFWLKQNCVLILPTSLCLHNFTLSDKAQLRLYDRIHPDLYISKFKT